MDIRRRARTSFVSVAAAGLLLAAAPTAAADGLPAPTRPALSIKVDDDTTKTKAKQVHTYTVKLRNLGSTNLRQMVLTETLPVGMSLISATDGGALNGADGQIVWTVDVLVGQEVTRTIKARVDKLPAGHGIASTACARLAGSNVPVVCSTDLDQLPTEAELAAAAGTTATLYGITASLLVAGGGAWYVRRRRKNATAAAGTKALQMG